MSYLTDEDKYYTSNQARLFEQSSIDSLPSYFFVNNFLSSFYAEIIDQNKLELTGISDLNIYEEIKNNLKRSKGCVYPPETMHWIGFVYRYISNISKIKSSELLRKISLNYLVDAYDYLHTLDIEKAKQIIFADNHIKILTKEEKIKKMFSF